MQSQTDIGLLHEVRGTLFLLQTTVKYHCHGDMWGQNWTVAFAMHSIGCASLPHVQSNILKLPPVP